MIINGDGITEDTRLKIKAFDVHTQLALKWVQAADGNWKAVDRDADTYSSYLDFYGLESEINTIIDEFEANRLEDGVITLSGFNLGEHIFGADVDYSDTITCTIKDMPQRAQSSWKIWKLARVFVQAISFDFVGSAAMPTLRFCDIGYTADSEYTFRRYDTFSGSFTTVDRQADSGIFDGVFRLSHTEMRDFRRQIATTRGGNLVIPSAKWVGGIDNVFGRRSAAGDLTVKIIDWSDYGYAGSYDSNGLPYWNIRLKLAEVI